MSEAEYIRITPSPEMRAVILAAAGLPDQAVAMLEQNHYPVRDGAHVIWQTQRPPIGATRTCPEPGCGKPQHYVGIELGWAHDALVDTWHCADPRKAGA